VGPAAQLTDLDPALRVWAVTRPLQLLELGEDAVTAARVALWLQEHPSPGSYVRQLSLPGVHSKFIEGHRRVIDAMLAVLQPGHAAASRVDEAPPVGRVNEVPSSSVPPPIIVPQDSTPAARFAARHGFLQAPASISSTSSAPRIRRWAACSWTKRRCWRTGTAGGTEPTPSRAVLTRLTAPEAELYRVLQQDVYGPSVRLEQELIRSDWAVIRLLN